MKFRHIFVHEFKIELSCGSNSNIWAVTNNKRNRSRLNKVLAKMQVTVTFCSDGATLITIAKQP